MNDEFDNETWAETVQRCIDDKWMTLAKNPLEREPDCLLCVRDGAENRTMTPFIPSLPSLPCSRCPVKKVSGMPGCINTPYIDWQNTAYHLNRRKCLPDEISAAAYDEITFLYKVKIYCIENDL